MTAPFISFCSSFEIESCLDSKDQKRGARSSSEAKRSSEPFSFNSSRLVISPDQFFCSRFSCRFQRKTERNFLKFWGKLIRQLSNSRIWNPLRSPLRVRKRRSLKSKNHASECTCSSGKIRVGPKSLVFSLTSAICLKILKVEFCLFFSFRFCFFILFVYFFSSFFRASCRRKNQVPGLCLSHQRSRGCLKTAWSPGAVSQLFCCDCYFSTSEKNSFTTHIVHRLHPD